MKPLPPLPRRQALRTLGAIGALATTGGLAGCASPRVADYAQEQPRFDLRTFFDGPLSGRGLFFDRSGRVVKRFVVDMVGQWQGASGTLDERFRYSDGSTSTRLWRLDDLGQGRYQGRADDVIGTATGDSAGNAFHWLYTLALPVDGRVWQVTLDDWMFQVDERTVLNRSRMSKLGIDLGELVLDIRRS
ncbi:MAG: hypothetical protein RI907_3985 [Pseudomonadota bacterium]